MSFSGMKGISPLVATVLLIAFVVAIAGIIATWANTFAKDQTQLVTEQSELSITCSYGAVQLKNVAFNATESSLSGTIENNGQISLGGMALSIVYTNATSQDVGLCNGPSGAVTCAAANLSLGIAGQTTFDSTIWGSNYESVKLITNCSSAGDTVKSSDISSSS